MSLGRVVIVGTILSAGIVAAAQNAIPAATPAAPAAATVVNSPAVLPGNGLAQHPFLYCGEWNYVNPEQTIWIIRDGKPAWSYSIPYDYVFEGKKDFEELGDCTLLANGNVVFSSRRGASIVTPDKKIVWHIDVRAGGELHSIQAIGLDHVLVTENGDPIRMRLINTKTNAVEKEVDVKPGDPTQPHPQLRRARMTAAGTFLIAHMDDNRVTEYNGEGDVVWNYVTPSPWAALRLANGNTLITGNAKGGILEVNKKGEVVWRLDRKDLADAGYKIGCIQDVARLANGDTVFSNWIPNDVKDPAQWPTTAQLIEVNPAKKVVWALRQWTDPRAGTGQRDTIPGPAGTLGGDTAASLAKAARARRFGPKITKHCCGCSKEDAYVRSQPITNASFVVPGFLSGSSVRVWFGGLCAGFDDDQEICLRGAT